MSRRRHEQILSWANELLADQCPRVAALVGCDHPPEITLTVAHGIGAAALTRGTDITLDYGWFVAHPDDAGCVVHEIAHAVMRVPAYEPSVGWLTEGIADYVRDVLGFESAHTFAAFRHGGAMRGYQSTAHFLMWLGRRRPGAVEDVSRRLSAGSYDVDVFRDLTGTPLYELVDTYEVEHEDRPIRRWGAPH